MEAIDYWSRIEITLVKPIGAGIGQQCDRIFRPALMRQGLLPEGNHGIEEMALILHHATISRAPAPENCVS